MTYLRTAREKTKSEDITRQLEVVNNVKETEENWKRWKEHVSRMSPIQYPHSFLLYKLC